MDEINQTNSDTLTKTHKCSINGCKNRGPFNAENLLSRHFKTAHSSVKFGCYKCERKFTDQAILFVHLSLNHSVEIPDKRQILLFDGSKDEPIGFLEVEERLEFVDEANGLLTNSNGNDFDDSMGGGGGSDAAADGKALEEAHFTKSQFGKSILVDADGYRYSHRYHSYIT